MRSFIAAAAALFVAGVTAQTTSDYLSCANAVLDGIDVSDYKNCTDKSKADCYCANKDAVPEISDSAASTCKDAGVDVNDLSSSLCHSSGDSAPARHASNPMEPAKKNGMQMAERAYAPPAAASPAAPRVIYVTETKTECGCQPTPTPFDPKHLSQIPVDVPASSSMVPNAAMSSPAHLSNGVLVGASSSSRVFGSQMSATPTPSGASAHRFNAFEGAAPKVSPVHGFAAAGVAAVMGFMAAL